MSDEIVILGAIEREALRGVIAAKSRAEEITAQAEAVFREVVAAILQSRGLERDDVIHLEDLDRGLVCLKVHPRKIAEKEALCNPTPVEPSATS